MTVLVNISAIDVVKYPDLSDSVLTLHALQAFKLSLVQEVLGDVIVVGKTTIL